jgi:AcrR family transcriptional regulator
MPTGRATPPGVGTKSSPPSCCRMLHGAGTRPLPRQLSRRTSRPSRGRADPDSKSSSPVTDVPLVKTFAGAKSPWASTTDRFANRPGTASTMRQRDALGGGVPRQLVDPTRRTLGSISRASCYSCNGVTRSPAHGPLPSLRFSINSINVKVAARRPYRMSARADAAEATGERILDAVVELFWERPVDQILLDDVASRAGVSVQTVIRRFGGKETLIAAAGARESARVRLQRDQALVGDIAGAVRVLVEHYEAVGDRGLKLLAEEDRVPGLREIADQGREYHREWCGRVFSSALAGLNPADHERRLAQVVAVCDVYMWMLLRRDAGLSRDETELALVELLEPLTKEDR